MNISILIWQFLIMKFFFLFYFQICFLFNFFFFFSSFVFLQLIILFFSYFIDLNDYLSCYSRYWRWWYHQFSYGYNIRYRFASRSWEISRNDWWCLWHFFCGGSITWWSFYR